jgi:hypothetical protein
VRSLRDIPQSLRASRVAVFIGFATLCALIHWRAGTYRSEFGRYSDEGMHYVTGLLIRSFILSGKWLHPMPFAQDFYAHFPKVALGNWPPVFETLQAVWSFVFGVSRISMLLLVQFLAVILACLVFNEARRRTGAIFAALAAGLLLASPLTQYVSSMVMAEVPLCLFSFLAILAWTRFQSSGHTRDAMVFAAWTSVAIMTKGNAWLIPGVAALTLMVTGAWGLLRNRGLWLAALLVAAVCLPYTLFTMRVVTQGWNSQALPDLRFLIASLGVHTRFAVGILGVPLTLIAAAGVASRVIVPLVRREKAELFWIVLAVYGVVILLFHAVVPTSIEPRKIYQIVPVMCLFTAGALADLSAMALWSGLRPVLAAAAAAVFWFTGFVIIPPFSPGFSPAICAVLARPDIGNAAILIASNPYFDDFEAALIAEWASRRRDSGTYLLRATKILSQTRNGRDSVEFVPYDSTAPELQARLASIPVTYVIVDTSPAEKSYRHHELLLETLENNPEDWELVYSATGMALGKPHQIRIFHCRRDLRGVAVHFEIDLTHKIRRSINVGPSEH